MHVHPVTVMLLMFMMGSLFGLSGMVIAVPGYAIVKEIVKFIAGLYQNIKISRKLKDKKEAVTK